MILSPALLSMLLVEPISFSFHFGNIEKLDMTTIVARNGNNLDSRDCVVFWLREVETLMFAEWAVKVTIIA